MSLLFGSDYTYISDASYFGITVPLTDNKFVVIYTHHNAPRTLNARVGTVSGTIISYGSEEIIYSGNRTAVNAISLTDSKIVVAYRDIDDDNTGEIKIGNITGTTINFGNEYEYSTAYQTRNNTLCRLTDSKFVICWERWDDILEEGINGRARIGSVAGTTVSYGSGVNFSNQDLEGLSVVAVDEGKFLLSYIFESDNDGWCIIGTISGTNISFGTKYQYHDNCDTSLDKVSMQNLAYIGNSGFVVNYRDIADNHGEAKVGSINGTTINFGSGYPYTSGGIEYPVIAAHSLISNTIITIYRDLNNSNYGTAQIGTIYDSQIIWSDEAIFHSGGVQHMIKPSFLTYDKFVVAFRDNSDSNYGKAVIGQNTLLKMGFDSTLFVHAHQLIATSWYPDTWGNRIR